MTGRVVCMVRGGEAGRKAQEAAITYALQEGLPLVFLHIIHLRGLNLENDDMMEPGKEEMAWLARVVLSLARRRAEAAGVQADIAFRFGPILETTANFVSESPVDRIFLGSPHPDEPDYTEKLARVRNFAGRLTDVAGVPVEIANEK